MWHTFSSPVNVRGDASHSMALIIIVQGNSEIVASVENKKNMLILDLIKKKSKIKNVLPNISVGRPIRYPDITGMVSKT